MKTSTDLFDTYEWTMLRACPCMKHVKLWKKAIEAEEEHQELIHLNEIGLDAWLKEQGH